MNAPSQCPHSEDRLQQYHDGVLDTESTHAWLREFEAHLPSCPQCRQGLASLKTLKGLLHEEMRQAAEAPFLKDLETRVLSRIQREKILPFPEIRFLNFSKAIAAAAVFLIALGGYWHFQYNGKNSLASSGKHEACEVDYFYSQTQENVVYYNVDDDTKVIWVLDEHGLKNGD